MQITSARITGYRPIQDSGELSVEPDLTCLVGKSGSGKTAVLQALYRLNPADPLAVFDEVADFPAALASQRWQHPERLVSPVVSARFRYSGREVAEIEDDLGPGALYHPEVTVSAGYESAAREITHHCDEAAIVRNLIARTALPAGAARAAGAQTTVAGFLTALDGLTEPSAAAEFLPWPIRNCRDVSIGRYLAEEYAGPGMPLFVYFSDQDIMPGTVTIPALIRRRDQDCLAAGERALVSLLNLAGLSPETFYQAGQQGRLIRQLDNAAGMICQEIGEYCPQADGQDIRVEIQAGTRKRRDGPVLQILARSRRHRAAVPLDQGPRGLAWLFSLLACTFDLAEDRTPTLILLLDNPGQPLHGRAQQHLLRFIENRLAARHQVLYTTHSPFMISPRDLRRVRTVIDHSTGTRISADISEADEDTLLPLIIAANTERTWER